MVFTFTEVLRARCNIQILTRRKASTAHLPPALNPEVSPADVWRLLPQTGLCTCKPAHVDIYMLGARITHSFRVCFFHMPVYLGHLCTSGHMGLPRLLHEPRILWMLLFVALWPTEFFSFGQLQARLPRAPVDTIGVHLS